MTNNLITSYFVCLLLLGAVSAAAQKGTAVFKAGFSEKDITPDIGMEAPGNYGKRYHTSFNDRCKVRAVVFDDGDKRVALVGLDLLFVTRDVVQAARTEIHKRSGIEPEAIMIGASHSHSSGPIGMSEPGDYDNASPLVQDLVENKSITSDPGYTQHLKHQIVEAVVHADANRIDAKLAVGVGHEDKVSFNRRLRMKNGLTFSHPGVGNPDIIDYAGPIDPDVGTVGVWDLHDNLLGVIVNFSNHATTNPGGISANWIGPMERTLRRATGHAALPVVFLQGACGDITQVDNLAKHANPSSREWWEMVGGRVGAEAYKTLLLVRRGAARNIPLDYRQKVWHVDRRVPAPEKVKRAMNLVVRDPQEVGSTEWVFAKETVLLDALLKNKPQAEVEVQSIQVGPIAFVSNPAEYFVQYGLDIKKGSNFPFTFVVELANGCVGYVPTEEAFSKHGGGYETRLTSYSNLEITAGTQFANEGIRLTNEMTPGDIPEPPPAPEFKTPWSYGNVAPEVD
ncbi:hypothetical protein KUV50_16045 [Membranicola marinus]|uniref:Neutral ceramidase n=1 Tax=Membranihabitans marinus TaxID=1227546 RepID=A0A953LCM6_9BACT|nr:hypothetical protein [Membranihabitans marinus]MBY5959666.1 hypothetical protein [Membranihabitans marinus]